MVYTTFVESVCTKSFNFYFLFKTCRYGDRAPISVLGRTFAVAWILVGICICSIFTATLTTSLTTISLDTKKSLPGSKVVIYSTYINMNGIIKPLLLTKFNVRFHRGRVTKNGISQADLTFLF